MQWRVTNPPRYDLAAQPARSASEGYILMSCLKALGLRPEGSSVVVRVFDDLSFNKLRLRAQTLACAAGWFRVDGWLGSKRSLRSAAPQKERSLGARRLDPSHPSWFAA
jgi:hypothetical protein